MFIAADAHWEAQEVKKQLARRRTGVVHRRLHQQCGTGLGIGGAGQQLRGVEQFSDLGLLGSHVARPVGGFHDFGAVYTHFMA